MRKKSIVKKEETKKDKHKHFPCFNILTVLLAIFLIQLICSFCMNTAKVYSLQLKINKLEEMNKIAQRKNTLLRDELEKYSSSTGVEALARNRLQLTEDDEILIILKNSNY